MEPYSVVLTSCGRFDLLERTLRSLLVRLRGPVSKFILIEDSGQKDIFDVVRIFDSDIQVLINEPPIGQLASIDRAYDLVNTEWVFHCEDDWEFLSYDFIEVSYKILKNFPLFSTLVLAKAIPPEGSRKQYFDGISYFLPDPSLPHGFMAYSFTPSLRRLSDYHKVAPFAKTCKNGREWDVSECFKALGYSLPYLEVPAIRHLGDGRHIEDPTSIYRSSGFAGHLRRSMRKRMRELDLFLHPEKCPVQKVLRKNNVIDC